MAPSGLLKAFAGVDPPTGKRPQTGKGRRFAADQENGKVIRIALTLQSEDHDADSDGRPGPPGRIGCRLFSHGIASKS